MLEEKLKEAIVAELKRQAANDPQSLRIESSDGLVVEGKIDLDDLAMVIAAPLQADRNDLSQCLPASRIRNRECRRTFSHKWLNVDIMMVGRGHDGTDAPADRQFD